MGPRGQTEEVGFLRPSLVLTAGHATLIASLLAVVLIAARRRRPIPVTDGHAVGTEP
jgi:hypothetical protein